MVEEGTPVPSEDKDYVYWFQRTDLWWKQAITWKFRALEAERKLEELKKIITSETKILDLPTGRGALDDE